MALSDYQIQLPDGTVAGAGTAVGYLEATGLRGIATVRDADVDRAGVDGSVPGMSFLTKKTVAVKWLIANPAIGLEAAMLMVARNWQNIQNPASVCMTASDYLLQLAGGGSRTVSALQFKLPNRPDPLVAFGKPGKLDPPVNSAYQFGWVEMDSDWIVPDGKVYDATPNTASATLPTSQGTAKFPWSFAVNFGPSTGGTLAAVNNGLYPANPVFKIVGPVTNPKISNPVTGQYIRINLTLMTGDVLLIDTGARVVRLNGVNRNTALDVGSSLFPIPVGGVNLSFSSTDGGTVAGTATVYTLDTYSVV